MDGVHKPEQGEVEKDPKDHEKEEEKEVPTDREKSLVQEDSEQGTKVLNLTKEGSSQKGTIPQKGESFEEIVAKIVANFLTDLRRKLSLEEDTMSEGSQKAEKENLEV